MNKGLRPFFSLNRKISSVKVRIEMSQRDGARARVSSRFECKMADPSARGISFKFARETRVTFYEHGKLARTRARISSPDSNDRLISGAGSSRRQHLREVRLHRGASGPASGSEIKPPSDRKISNERGETRSRAHSPSLSLSLVRIIKCLIRIWKWSRR